MNDEKWIFLTDLHFHWNTQRLYISIWSLGTLNLTKWIINFLFTFFESLAIMFAPSKCIPV